MYNLKLQGKGNEMEDKMSFVLQNPGPVLKQISFKGWPVVKPRPTNIENVREAIQKKNGLVMEFFHKGSDPPLPPYFWKLWNP